MVLFDCTGGQNWDASSDWGTDSPLSSWYGVTVEEGHVTKLELMRKSLSGIL
ncbi:unnamed protein product, partial [Chrysoparadoxa australica]